ncbi:MAG: ABC transporter ATP-binding protein [Planctomycetota bacterium]|nr:ABC transporter ATP-binding protein [Planctomycetota bacterium]
MTAIHCRGLAKSFDGTVVLRDFDLVVESGAFVSLLGASGCGKTTALRLVAGLETPDAGRIEVGERVVVDAATGAFIAPEARRIGMVFQSYAVWPHMTVLENVAYPLRVRGVAKAQRESETRRILAVVGLDGLEERKPAQLSGGQQQRVALARGLIMEPDVLLLDEPLSNLDAKLRVRMRRDIRRIQQETGFTVLYVTHDQEEALAISDRLVILEGGEILAQGTPDELRDHPFLASEEASA